jgi:hypothetical protein
LSARRCPPLAAANAAGGSIIEGLIDDQSIILAEAQVPADHSAPHGLCQLAHGCAAVLRVVDKGCPGLRCLGELRHVERHC